MANKRITDLTEITSLPEDGVLEVVDVTNATDSPDGSSFKIKKSNLVSSNVSVQRTGNTLVFDNVTGAFYNSDDINGTDITLSNAGSVSGGRTVIFSKSETTPTIISPNDLRQNGTYNTSTDRTNVLTFEKMPNGDFLLNIWDYESTLSPPSDLSFLNPLVDIDAANATFDGSNTILTIPDSSGNGNDFTPILSPKYVANGINGLPSIRLDGNSYLQRAAPIGVTDTSKRVVIQVFQIEDTASTGGNYQTVSIAGVDSYTSPGSYVLLANLNNNKNSLSGLTPVNALNTFNSMEQTAKHFVIANKSSSELSVNIDDKYLDLGTGTSNVPDQNIFIGAWSGNKAKMLLSRYLVLDNDTLLNTGDNLELLKIYLKVRYNFVTVFNEGVSNDSTSQVIDRLTDINANNSENTPLMIGTNDWSYTDASRKRTPAEYKTNLTTIVQSLKANGSTVILMQIPPILQTSPRVDQICVDNGESAGCDVNLTGDPYRVKLLEVVSEESTFYLDTQDVFNNAPNPIATYYNADGVHPNDLGTELLANSVKDFMVANSIDYNAPKTVTCIGDSITFGFGVTDLKKYPNILSTIL